MGFREAELPAGCAGRSGDATSMYRHPCLGGLSVRQLPLTHLASVNSTHQPIKQKPGHSPVTNPRKPAASLTRLRWDCFLWSAVPAPAEAKRDLVASMQAMPHHAAAVPAAGGAVQGADEFIQVDAMGPWTSPGRKGRMERSTQVETWEEFLAISPGVSRRVTGMSGPHLQAGERARPPTEPQGGLYCHSLHFLLECCGAREAETSAVRWAP